MPHGSAALAVAAGKSAHARTPPRRENENTVAASAAAVVPPPRALFFYYYYFSFFVRFFHSFSFAIYWWRTEFSRGRRRPPAVAAVCHEPLIILTLATLPLSSSVPHFPAVTHYTHYFIPLLNFLPCYCYCYCYSCDDRHSIYLNKSLSSLPVRHCASTSSASLSSTISALHWPQPNCFSQRD